MTKRRLKIYGNESECDHFVINIVTITKLSQNFESNLNRNIKTANDMHYAVITHFDCLGAV